MQPAQAGDTGANGGSSVRKWGPIAAIVAVIALIGGIIVVSSGGDDDEATGDTIETPSDSAAATEPAGTEPAIDDTSAVTEPAGTEPVAGGGEITFPLSFSQAEEQGIDVAWGDRCNTDSGQLAVRDFFAPECYAPFEGDNGGDTATGVTADSIKVVWYQGPDQDPIINYITDAIAVDDTNADATATMERMIEYYETYYEFYGRSIDVEVYESTGIATDEVTARADAVRIAEDINPFVVLGGPALTSAFADELAARAVMCISCTPAQPEAFYAEREPLVWGIDSSAVQARAHATEFISKQLVGNNAVHAGDPAFQETPRKFGLVYIESSAESKNTADAFVADLTAAGADVAEVLPYALDPATIQASASQIIGKLKAAGITTVIFTGDPIAPRDFTREATAQEYFPEWVFAASTLTDLNAFARTYDQEQWSHAFGVSSLAARVRPEGAGYYSLYQWFTGEEAPADDTIGTFVPPFALFFAVVQGTGPDLTYENWRDALYAGTGTVPAISQPFLSWGEQGYWPGLDYFGIDDATVVWWDPAATGPDEIRREGTGMYQFVDGGKRYLPGEWPADDRLFNPEGAVTIYDVPPAGEAPPDIPSPAG